jgi:hypothetical protein
MTNEEHIKELNCEISKLKDKLLLTENELNETKHKLNTYQTNSKKYYEVLNVQRCKKKVFTFENDLNIYLFKIICPRN